MNSRETEVRRTEAMTLKIQRMTRTAIDASSPSDAMSKAAYDGNMFNGFTAAVDTATVHIESLCRQLFLSPFPVVSSFLAEIGGRRLFRIALRMARFELFMDDVDKVVASRNVSDASRLLAVSGDRFASLMDCISSCRGLVRDAMSSIDTAVSRAGTKYNLLFDDATLKDDARAIADAVRDVIKSMQGIMSKRKDTETRLRDVMTGEAESSDEHHAPEAHDDVTPDDTRSIDTAPHSMVRETENFLRNSMAGLKDFLFGENKGCFSVMKILAEEVAFNGIGDWSLDDDGEFRDARVNALETEMTQLLANMESYLNHDNFGALGVAVDKMADRIDECAELVTSLFGGFSEDDMRRISDEVKGLGGNGFTMTVDFIRRRLSSAKTDVGKMKDTIDRFIRALRSSV